MSALFTSSFVVEKYTFPVREFAASPPRSPHRTVGNRSAYRARNATTNAARTGPPRRHAVRAYRPHHIGARITHANLGHTVSTRAAAAAAAYFFTTIAAAVFTSRAPDFSRRYPSLALGTRLFQSVFRVFRRIFRRLDRFSRPPCSLLSPFPRRSRPDRRRSPRRDPPPSSILTGSRNGAPRSPFRVHYQISADFLAITPHLIAPAVPGLCRSWSRYRTPYVFPLAFLVS